MKTRTKGSVKTGKEPTELVSTTQIVKLGTDITNPPHIVILPNEISNDARIISLQHPRHLTESRYVVCPEKGFYEFTSFGAPKTTPRSWLLSSQELSSVKEANGTLEESNHTDISDGYVTKTANLLIATRTDPLFLMLPALAPVTSSKGSHNSKKLFLSGEDYLDRIAASSSQLNTFLKMESIKTLLEQRMANVSDTAEAGDETMYRINEKKLLEELLRKAKSMAKKGLPQSMEEKLVGKALETPILSIGREDSSMHELANEESFAETPDTQTTPISLESAATSFSEVSTVASSFSGDSISVQKPPISSITAPEGIPELLRLRTALFLICSKYVPPHLTESLKILASSPSSPIDFTPLDTHLAYLAKLRQDALASRSLGDYSRKRSMLDDEDTEIRAEKKRKEEEEEKRKRANESRGVKALKKVNTTGMKKMSDFFKKK